MDAAGYILITGLAISDMVVSLHGLLANRRHITWDWLALVAAAFIFLQIVASWGISYRAFDDLPQSPWVWEFVLSLCQTIALYLAARAVFPDHVQLGDRVDLAAHYSFISRYFWASLSVTYTLYLMFGGIGRLWANWPAVVGFVAIIALAIWSDRRLHRLIVPMAFALMCVVVLPRRLLGG
jgi:hypothetical protein